MQVILDSSFVRPGSAPIWGGKKGGFRDWTNVYIDLDDLMHVRILNEHFVLLDVNVGREIIVLYRIVLYTGK